MSEWSESFFDGDWALTQPEVWTAEQTRQDVDEIEGILGLADASRVLDVPCGDGRIALELARRGHEVVGVDFSETMLGRAEQSASAEDLSIEWRRRDMRDLPWSGRFDAAVCWWGSFGYFEDDGNRRFLQSVAGTLIPGSSLLLDSPGLEALLPNWQSRNWSRAGDTLVLEERKYDPVHGRVEGAWTIIRDGRESVVKSSVRLYTLRELNEMCRSVGFRECFGVDPGTGGVVEQGFPGRLFVARK